MTASRTWTGRAFLGTSLDGFIAGDGGDLGFLSSAPGAGKHTAIPSARPALEWESFYPHIDTLVLGRVTYEQVLTFDEWPYAGRRVIVLSTTLPLGAGRGARVAPGPANPHGVEFVRSVEEAAHLLQASRAAHVYVDGGKTVQEFLARGLLDELTVAVLPVAIGRGTRLFDGGVTAEFAVRGSHVTSDGLVRTTYEVLHGEQ